MLFESLLEIFKKSTVRPERRIVSKVLKRQQRTLKDDRYQQRIKDFQHPQGGWEYHSYKPLPSAVFTVRLLELEPGDGDEIHCKLRNVHLGDERVQYEALSYTWGTPILRQFIWCDGKVLPVTQNLYNALRRLRQTNEKKLLWIDAICINQEDLEERNHQVV